MSLVETLINTIKTNPEVQKKINSNGVTKEYWDTLQSGDQSKGEALANKIMQTYGLTKEQAVEQASQGLQNMFGGMFK